MTTGAAAQRLSPAQVGPKFPPVKTNPDGSLNYESVVANYDTAMDWLSTLCE